jgi:uncharacterized membrane protein
MLALVICEGIISQQYFFMIIFALIAVLMIIGIFFVIKMYRNAKHQRGELHKIVKEYEEIIKNRTHK